MVVVVVAIYFAAINTVLHKFCYHVQSRCHPSTGCRPKHVYLPESFDDIDICDQFMFLC